MKEARWLLPILTVALLLAFVGSLLVGRVWFDPAQMVHAVLAPQPQLAGLIVTELRLPRAVLACISGAALGLSGAVLQGLTRNPLAEPGLLGVTGGAALGAVLAIYFGVTLIAGVGGPLL